MRAPLAACLTRDSSGELNEVATAARDDAVAKARTPTRNVRQPESIADRPAQRQATATAPRYRVTRTRPRWPRARTWP